MGSIMIAHVLEDLECVVLRSLSLATFLETMHNRLYQSTSTTTIRKLRFSLCFYKNT